MLLIIHNQAKNLVSIRYQGEALNLEERDLCTIFWKLAEKFSDEIIVWCEKEFENELNNVAWPNIFHHDLIMASYSIKSNFIPEKIGYIDQLPFVKINRKVQYPTWRMSTDVGGINGKVLLQFREMYSKITDFGFLLNSIAKLGQQNGLFCYSAPQLIKPKLQQRVVEDEVKSIAGNLELFTFVQANYKNIRLWLLFWCFVKYEKSFPIGTLIMSLFEIKYFNKNIDLSDITVKSLKSTQNENTIDVIIPTLGRKKYLLQVLEDLKSQERLPKRVIIVEQNPNTHSHSDLPEIKAHIWPFEVVHHFTHKTGACYARNLALDEVESEWIFFADDDIRFEADLLQKSMVELVRLGANCLNINCKQEEQTTVFYKIKQWGSFGSGTSIVNTAYCKNLRFHQLFEYGFGEDQDYGMQLRNAGCDIIYHPEIEILHLKASRGGFRNLKILPWEGDNPKPSPTLMIYAKKYYNEEQLKGYKNELFFRYYSRQKIKNPLRYLKQMEEGWRRSEEWSERLKKSFLKSSNRKITNEV
jgi:GT2 family glycosyltransferase